MVMQRALTYYSSDWWLTVIVDTSRQSDTDINELFIIDQLNNIGELVHYTVHSIHK